MYQISNSFRQSCEIFTFDEGQDLLCAVTECVSAVAISDNCVVLRDRGLFFDDRVAASMYALPDLGVVELNFCGGRRKCLGEGSAICTSCCSIRLRLFLRSEVV